MKYTINKPIKTFISWIICAVVEKKMHSDIQYNKYPTSVKLLDDKLNLPGHIRVFVFKETLKNLLHSLNTKRIRTTILIWLNAI